jgi:hypothetical protein
LTQTQTNLNLTRPTTLGVGLVLLYYITLYFAILDCDELGTTSAFASDSISAVDNEDAAL